MVYSMHAYYDPYPSLLYMYLKWLNVEDVLLFLIKVLMCYQMSRQPCQVLWLVLPPVYPLHHHPNLYNCLFRVQL